jgi:RNA polymerase sigma factor (sigma-70 family)
MREGVSGDVIRRALEGDASAVETICKAYEGRLRGLFWDRGTVPPGADVDDLVQDAIAAALKGLRRGRVAPANFEKWLFAAAKNIRVEALRGRYRRRREAEAARSEAEAPAEDPCEREERRRALARAIESLPEKYRKVVTLRLEGLLYREIAEKLGANPRTVATRLRRAYRMLGGELRRRD